MYNIDRQGSACYPVDDFIKIRFVKEWQKTTDGRKDDNRIRIIPAPHDTYNMTYNYDYSREQIA